MLRLLAGWLAILLVSAAAACGDDDTDSTDVEASDGGVEGTVLVFAAASLTDAFAAVESAFEATHPGADVQLNLAGSSALREQILEGAPADVFASANEPNMDQVADEGLVVGEPQIFARNVLQIAVPAGNPGDVMGLDDFANDDLLIGLCAEGVPCGDFGREVLANAGVKAAIDTNEPDVRALLTKIGADELDAGLVYVTDVTAAADAVEGIDVPADVYVDATYPIAPLAEAPNPHGATAFVEFVLSAEGQAILTRFGFGPA